MIDAQKHNDLATRILKSETENVAKKTLFENFLGFLKCGEEQGVLLQ